jgi:hypothetical protein
MLVELFDELKMPKIGLDALGRFEHKEPFVISGPLS